MDERIERSRICKTPGCGKVILYDPCRQHQHQFCADCRSRYGRNTQKRRQKAAAKKRRMQGEFNG